MGGEAHGPRHAPVPISIGKGPRSSHSLDGHSSCRCVLDTVRDDSSASAHEKRGDKTTVLAQVRAPFGRPGDTESGGLQRKKSLGAV